MRQGIPRILIPLPTREDSEYNHRSWPQYAQAIAQSGGEPVLLDLASAPGEQAKLLGSADAVLLPGSPADVDPQRYGEARQPQCAAPDPAREAADELLLQDAFNLKKPILGICYGMQSLNVWRGGTLIQHLETGVNHRPGRTIADAHPVSVADESRLGTLVSDLSANPRGIDAQAWTNSSHHQAVLLPGGGLRVTAACVADGVVEAVEGALDQFVLGVQWHPERTFQESPLSRAIFRSFVDAAAAWRANPEAAERRD